MNAGFSPQSLDMGNLQLLQRTPGQDPAQEGRPAWLVWSVLRRALTSGVVGQVLKSEENLELGRVYDKNLGLVGMATGGSYGESYGQHLC